MEESMGVDDCWILLLYTFKWTLLRFHLNDQCTVQFYIHMWNVQISILLSSVHSCYWLWSWVKYKRCNGFGERKPAFIKCLCAVTGPTRTPLVFPRWPSNFKENTVEFLLALNCKYRPPFVVVSLVYHSLAFLK